MQATTAPRARVVKMKCEPGTYRVPALGGRSYEAGFAVEVDGAIYKHPLDGLAMIYAKRSTAQFVADSFNSAE
jgi:hypothetical protein